MRTRAVVLVFALLAAGTIALIAGPAAHAVCAAPTVEVSPTHGSPGSQVTITGHYWSGPCHDTVVCHVYTPSPSPVPSGSPTPTPSATTSCEPLPPMEPTTNIKILFTQKDLSWTLGTVDANSEGSIRLVAAVPIGAVAGTAVIRGCPGGHCFYPAAAFRVGSLAETGSRNLAPAVAAGVAATLAGIGVLAFVRRRFTSHV